VNEGIGVVDTALRRRPGEDFKAESSVTPRRSRAATSAFREKPHAPKNEDVGNAGRALLQKRKPPRRALLI